MFLIVVDECWVKDMYIVCQYYQIWGVGVDFMYQLMIECFLVGKLILCQCMGWDVGQVCVFKVECISFVIEYCMQGVVYLFLVVGVDDCL